MNDKIATLDTPEEEEFWFPGCEEEEESQNSAEEIDDEGVFFETFAEIEGVEGRPAMQDLEKNNSKKEWDGVPSPTTYMPLGRHTGNPLESIPGDYLGWATSEIPQEFYALYLPRFTPEAQEKYLAFWDSIYNGFYSELLKESGFSSNNETTTLIYQALHKAGQEWLNTNPEENFGIPADATIQITPVKKRRNCYIARGTLAQILEAFTWMAAEDIRATTMEIELNKNFSMKPFSCDEFRILHAQETGMTGGETVYEVQYLQRSYTAK